MHDQNILFFKISRKYKPDTDNKTRMCQRIDPLLAMCRQLFFDLINVSIADTTTAEVKAQSGELCIFILRHYHSTEMNYVLGRNISNTLTTSNGII